MGQSVEDYYARWKHAIRNSDLSEPLKSDVLSSMDINDYFGMGVIAISVPPQSDLAFYGDEVYWRDGDATTAAVRAKKIDLQKRFA